MFWQGCGGVDSGPIFFVEDVVNCWQEFGRVWWNIGKAGLDQIFFGGAGRRKLESVW